jgi:murein tripeptide amidase MpaA
MQFAILFLILSCLPLVAQLSAAAAKASTSVWEPAVMQAAKSLADSTAAAPKDLLTTAESSSYRKTGTYAECVTFYRRLEKASPLARLASIGKTAEGRDLYVFIVSKDKAFTPQTAARTGKPIVLLQNGIHPGENGGKDASMMLLRDVLITKRHAAWLDHVIILSIPVFNADGHEHVSPYNRINEQGPEEMGFRTAATRLNLNRDYIKADTPEMKAWLRMYNSWLPDLLIDNHVTDGADMQYDLLLSAQTFPEVPAALGGWVSKQCIPDLFRRMEKDGHITGWYGIPTTAQSGAKVSGSLFSPRYSTSYAGIQNRAGLLIETHSLKSFKTRTWSHYDVMKNSLDVVASTAAALHQAVKDSDGAVASTKPGEPVSLEAKVDTSKTEPYTVRALKTEMYDGTAAGGKVRRHLPEPVNTQVQLSRELTSNLDVTAPKGYLVPASQTGLIELLKLHGVRTELLTKERKEQFATYRLSQARFASQPFEGRFLVSGFEVKKTREAYEMPAGSVYVPMEQRAARVAMHLLEPSAPDSLVRWGFFHGVFEQKEYFSDYIFEPIAEEMLAKDPQLKQEFDAKLKEDSFAKNPRTRLMWLFERSPFHESDKGRYPVVRVE